MFPFRKEIIQLPVEGSQLYIDCRVLDEQSSDLFFREGNIHSAKLDSKLPEKRKFRSTVNVIWWFFVLPAIQQLNNAQVYC